VLDQYERAWWLTHECVGVRMDEGNRLLRIDPDFETGLIHIPGTKTAKSECYLAMSSELQAELKAYLATRTDDSPSCSLAGPLRRRARKFTADGGRSKKISASPHSRRTSKKNPGASPMNVWKEWKRQGYPGGVKLTTTELRDYFATQVSAQLSDPNTVKELMRHTS